MWYYISYFHHWYQQFLSNAVQLRKSSYGLHLRGILSVRTDRLGVRTVILGLQAERNQRAVPIRFLFFILFHGMVPPVFRVLFPLQLDFSRNALKYTPRGLISRSSVRSTRKMIIKDMNIMRPTLWKMF